MTSVQNFYDEPHNLPLILVLDVILSSICELENSLPRKVTHFGHSVFYYLMQSRKRVYSDHAIQVCRITRVVFPVLLTFLLPQWTSRLIIILWQSAIPPTVCTVGVFLIYIASRHLSPV